ncbi:MAG: thioredoxin domain-containing protein [Planctomycetota bacterium]
MNKSVMLGGVGALGVIAGGIALLPLGAANAQQSAQDELASADLIAVKFHADWCGHCKAVSGYWDDLQETFAEDDVLFLTFDVTNDSTKHQTEMLATLTGQDDIWADHKGKNGFMVVIDANTGEILEKLTSRDTVATATSAVRKHI